MGFLTDIVFFVFLLEDGGHLNGFYGDDQRSWLRKGVKGTGVQAERGEKTGKVKVLERASCGPSTASKLPEARSQRRAGGERQSHSSTAVYFLLHC